MDIEDKDKIKNKEIESQDVENQDNKKNKKDDDNVMIEIPDWNLEPPVDDNRGEIWYLIMI